ALLVDVEPSLSNRRRRAWIRAVLREAEMPLREHIESNALLWRETAAAVASDFRSAQIRRAQAIAEWLADQGHRQFQAGLFDRRAERARRDQATESIEIHQRAQARATAAAVAAPLTTRPAELLLVLTP